MQQENDPQARRNGKRYLPPEIAIDLEADNALVRAALARSIGAGEQRELVTQELKHRIGNLLAVVHAIARQTFVSADPASMVDFSVRLHALAEAQKFLIDAETRPATLESVVTAALAAHCPDPDRATISGPELAINGRRAHALTLALHELATNAAKYGALSGDAGGIEIVWTVSGGQLGLLWREHGGPPVTAPTRRGFGTMLVTRNLAAAFAGEIDLQFQSTGLTCRLRAPANAPKVDAL